MAADPPTSTPKSPPDAGHAEPLPEPRTLRSEDLLRGDKEVVIVHENQLYRLRRTRNGKLILQK